MNAPGLLAAALFASLLTSACAAAMSEWRERVIRLGPEGSQVVGVECADGRIMAVTARHVLESAPALRLIAWSGTADVAVVELSVPVGFPLGENPSPDEHVVLIHSPMGFDRIATEGVVLGPVDQHHEFPIYAWAYFGSSGGAVLDQRGRLVGLVLGIQHMPTHQRVGDGLFIPTPILETVPIAWAVSVSAIRALLQEIGCP